MGSGENKCICGPMSACSARGRREQADCRFHRFVNDDGNCAYLRKSIDLYIDNQKYFHCDCPAAQYAARCPIEDQTVEEIEAERKEGIIPTMKKSLENNIDELSDAVRKYLKGEI